MKRRLAFAAALAVVVGRAIVACDSTEATPAPLDSGPDSPIVQPDSGGLDGGGDGGNDASDGSDGACQLPGSFGSAACNSCVRVTCCGRGMNDAGMMTPNHLGACQANTDCNALMLCILPCLNDPDAGGCYQGCLDVHPDGGPIWSDLETCWSLSDPPEGCGPDCT